ncbi:MAG: 4Fe-4S dicluster domain-containing protein [Thermodesulfobacteriota bacterium]
MNRRTFLAGGVAAAASTVLPVRPSQAAVQADSWASLIDLSLCDGCKGKEMPLCVASCRKGNSHRFPEPDPKELRDYWPQKRHEDWSDKRDDISQLTPYNWLFVQEVEVAGQRVHIPRRCMHCDNPPCAKLCPFGVMHKTKEGPVWVDPRLCFGGAKCRTVCPWSIPQRQAGVGIYTYWQEFMPVGAGVMFKCDLCREKLADGSTPHCMEKCPKKAMLVGRRDEIFQEARKRQEEYSGYVYGLEENGGTSTVYVSKVDFAAIDQAIRVEDQENPLGMNDKENMLERQKGWAMFSLAAPLVGGLAAFFATAAKEEDK